MKKLSFEARQTLKNEAEFHLKKLSDLDANIANFSSNLQLEQNRVLTAYYLNGVYSCLENIFEKIAKVFENHIENPAVWHSELLLRMRLDIDGIRPAVIDNESFVFLDELRSFRHVFRQSYMFSLDADRIELIVIKWKKHKKTVVSQISAFLKKVAK
ncbi:MAG: hypothetical protein JXB42_10115 [Deltaproteobacteria bacterium]|nr:hypothetical protein [Deltaproteobacteria bacterium]